MILPQSLRIFFAFYISLDIVGQIAEEVDAGLRFQILDAHGVIRQLVVSMIYFGVWEPHTDRLVVSLSLDHLLDEDCHKEILRYDELSLYALQNVFLLINGSTLANIHGVFGVFIAEEVMQIVFHLDPNSIIIVLL